MFIGEYHHSLDAKGRLAVPVKFRSFLEKGAVVTRGFDHCLFLYTFKEWSAVAGRIAQLPFNQADARAFSRLMLAGAMDVMIDKQGRIIVPDYLRSFARLSKNVVIAGLYNRLELWDEKEWQNYQERTEGNSEEIAERLTAVGI